MGYTLREVLDERHYKGMICQNHLDWLIEKVLAMRALLVEWRDTDFFETRAEWARWVEDFGGRVEKGLEGLEVVQTSRMQSKGDSVQS